MLESRIQRKIIKYLKSRVRITKKGKRKKKGFTYKHYPHPVGMPDVCHIESGIIFLFEVKRDEKHKPEPHQLLRHRQLRKVGCKVFVVWSAEQVKQIVEELL